MRKVNCLLVLLIFILTVNLFSDIPSSEKIQELNGKIIKLIDFKGLKNTKPASIIGLISISKNDKFNYDKVKKSFKNLYKLGYFDNIQIRAELDKKDNKVTLIYEFEERAIIGEFKIQGNQRVSQDDIMAVLTYIKGTRNIFKATNVEKDRREIKKLYKSKGYEDTEIRINSRYNPKTKKVDVTIFINEGDEVFIQRINIIGATKLQPNAMYGVMETKESSFFRGGQVLDKAKLKEDEGKIVQYCKSKGFINAKVVYRKIEKKVIDAKNPSKKGWFITIKIEEGEQYKTGDIKLKGNKVLSTEYLNKFVTLKKGKVYDDNVFQQNKMKIQNEYWNRGYLQIVVSPKPIIDNKKKIIGYEIDITEYRKNYIEKIFIEGNDKTKTHVIDRELMIREGEVFNLAKIKRSQERLFNTQYFKDVPFDIKQGSAEGLINLTFKVKEQRTGIVTLGIGIGTTSGFSGFAQIKENNLFGSGWSVSARVDYGQRTKNFQVDLNTPYLLSYTPIRFGISLAYRIIDYVPNLTVGDFIYEETLGSRATRDFNGDGKDQQTDDSLLYTREGFYGTLTAGYSLSDHWGIFGTYVIDIYKIYGLRYYDQKYYTDANWLNGFDPDIYQDFSNLIYVSENTLNPDNELYDDLHREDFRIKSSFRIGFSGDYRNLTLNTTKGFKFSQMFEYAGGILGGHSQFLRSRSDLSIYFNPVWKIVFAFHAQLDIMFPQFDGAWDISDSDKLTFRGDYELRGWSTYEQTYITGVSKLSMSLEARFPIYEKMLWGVLFIDSGNMSDTPGVVPIKFFGTGDYDNQVSGSNYDPTIHVGSGFKFSVGFGVRIHIPMLPIRLYYAWKFQMGENGVVQYQEPQIVFSVGDLF